jgi:glycosyltransferase involved in cell wall biosynthesis
MKILIRQFLGKNHSWSCCGWGWARALKNLGHEVTLFSTDGIKYLPADLKENLIGFTEENHPKIYGKAPVISYDCQISYTAMKNFPAYLSNGKKNRLGIWCYEWTNKNILPTGFAKHHQSCDMVCPPSQYAKRVFMESGIPENKITVISHGINIDEYKNTSTIHLPTKKKFKILANIAQNHKRKNIPGLLDAYGKAFTNNDDVCLIIKAKDRPTKFPFEVSLKDCLHTFYQKYPQHAEIMLYSQFIDNMSDLYRSVDCIYTMTHCECFYFPGLEAMASGKLNIAPAWGGQVDFLNDTNALLVSGNEERADPKSMYWESKNNAIWFRPSIDDAVDKLRFAYQNYEKLNEGIDKQRADVYAKFSWENVTKQFLGLCK